MDFGKITLATKRGPMEFDAVVSGVWAAHRFASTEPADREMWRVSHVPTGRAIGQGQGLLRLSDAVRLVELLAERLPVFAAGATLGEDLKPSEAESITVRRAWWTVTEGDGAP